ncbi:MAG: PQQ-binding-like beta-propeller repeat protein [Haloplanus sp.]
MNRDLGTVDPAGSRHAGRRSAVALGDEWVAVGHADGDVVAFETGTLAERWRASCDRGATSVVAAAPFDDGVLVGERSPRGEVRLHDAATGRVRWRRATAETVGDPTRETRFFLPFVVDVTVGDDRAYVASRRYERDGGEAGAGRSFESVVLAVESDGVVPWRFRTDASPIALAADADRVAVAYNRCPGAHDAGLVVLDAATGAERWRWDPPADDAVDTGDRRVGDVSLLVDGVAVTSHADFRGYRLGRGGDVRWRASLATPTAVGSETLYAYPNHAHATPDGVVFVTGNTYAAEGRETEGRHDRATAAFGYGPDGDPRWSASLRGFASGLAAAGRRVVVPVAQGFRTRDPDVHGVRVLDIAAGGRRHVDTAGVATAVAAGDRVAAVEEPVVYHDDGERHGAYRLHVTTPN